MADQIKTKPVEINLPVDIKLQAGKVDKSSFKAQLKELETFLGRQASTLEASELKAKILTEAISARQAQSLATVGSMHAFDPRKMANAPEPSKVVSKFTELAGPKSVKGSRGDDQLKTNQQLLEREIRHIFSSLKLDLEGNATKPSSAEQAAVKGMRAIFNKVKKGTSSETDLTKFAVSSNDYLAAMAKDTQMTSGLKSKRSNQIANLQRFMKERAAPEHALVGMTKELAKSIPGKQVESAPTIINPVLQMRKAVVDVAVAEALGLTKAIKSTTSSAGTSNAGVLSLLQKMQAITHSPIDQFAAANLVARGGVTPPPPIVPPAPPSTPSGGAEEPTPPEDQPEEIKKKAKEKAEATVKGMKEVFSNSVLWFKNPGQAAGNLFTSALTNALKLGMANPIAAISVLGGALVLGTLGAAAGIAFKITETITSGFIKGLTGGIKNAKDTIRSLSLSVYPLVARGMDATTARTAATLPMVENIGYATELWEVMGKVEQRFIRIVGNTIGVADYMKAITQYSVITGEEVAAIDDSFLEIAQFFKVDINKNAANLANHMTKVLLNTNATSQELRMIAQWLMPAFASGAGTAEDRFKGVLETAGRLAEVGLKQPRQLVQFGQAIEKFMNPDEKGLAVLASMGKAGNLFSGGAGKAEGAWNKTYDSMSQRIEKISKLQEKIGASSGSFASKQERLNKLQEIADLAGKELSSALNTAMVAGVSPKSANDFIRTIGAQLEDNPAFARQLGMYLGGATVASIREMFSALKEPIDLSKSLDKVFKEEAKDLGTIYKQAVSAGDAIFRIAGMLLTGDTQISFFTTIREALKGLASEYKVFLNLSDAGKQADTGLFGGLYKAGQLLNNVVKDYIGPAMTDYLKYMQLILNGGDASEKGALGKKISDNLAIGFSKFSDLILPLLIPVAEGLTRTFLTVFNTIAKSQPFKELITAFSNVLLGALQAVFSDKELLGSITTLGVSLGKAVAYGLLSILPWFYLMNKFGGQFGSGGNKDKKEADITTKWLVGLNPPKGPALNPGVAEMAAYAPALGRNAQLISSTPTLLQLDRMIAAQNALLNDLEAGFSTSADGLQEARMRIYESIGTLNEERARLKMAGKTQ
jgi:hypothetical protein